MREVLSRYLLIFKRMYPTHPSPETWEVYERALADVGDVDLTGACEICIRELTYFPMPAEILKRVTPADNFLVTSTVYEDSPLGDEDKKAFQAEMAALAEKLGVRPKPVREESAMPRQRSETNFVAMVGSATLREWALNQDFSDGLPRTRQEIELVKTIREYEKPKSMRRQKRLRGGVYES